MKNKADFEDMPDTDLAKAIEDNIDGSFEYFVDTYNKKIFNIAYRMLKNYDDASEMSQEVLFKIYRKINSFKGDCSLSTWVHRVTTNSCIDELRRRKNVVTVSLDKNIVVNDQEIRPELSDEEPSPEDIAEKKDLQLIIKKALDELPDDQRAILILREYDGLSYDEIADISKVPIGTVKSRINRARQSLRERLEAGNYFDPDIVL